MTFIMIRLHQCYDKLYYLHSSIFNDTDWCYIKLLYSPNINNDKYSKEALKRWLGLKNIDISISHTNSGILIYGNNVLYPMFYISYNDFTIYYFLIDVVGNNKHIIKYYYYNMFKYIRILENSSISKTIEKKIES